MGGGEVARATPLTHQPGPSGVSAPVKPCCWKLDAMNFSLGREYEKESKVRGLEFVIPNGRPYIRNYPTKQPSLSTNPPQKHRVPLTLPISRNLVSITTMVELCSHSIRQKSSVVSARGPCVAI